MDNNNIITLTNQDGEDEEFEFLDIVEYEGEEYVILMPCGEDADNLVMILHIENKGGEDESYATPDDDELTEKLFEIFKNKFREGFDFTDAD